MGCSGGNETDGTTCFSTRLMWRTSGAGEGEPHSHALSKSTADLEYWIVYAYIPETSKSFCSQSNIICNSDYGTSLARGSFSLVTGQWQTIWLMVILNEVGIANGVIESVPPSRASSRSVSPSIHVAVCPRSRHLYPLSPRSPVSLSPSPPATPFSQQPPPNTSSQPLTSDPSQTPFILPLPLLPLLPLLHPTYPIPSPTGRSSQTQQQLTFCHQIMVQQRPSAVIHQPRTPVILRTRINRRDVLLNLLRRGRLELGDS